MENFEKYIKLSKKIPEEVYKVLKEITDIERFSDVIIANLSLKVEEKQSLLESGLAKDRLEAILSILEGELMFSALNRRFKIGFVSKWSLTREITI